MPYAACVSANGALLNRLGNPQRKKISVTSLMPERQTPRSERLRCICHAVRREVMHSTARTAGQAAAHSSDSVAPLALVGPWAKHLMALKSLGRSARVAGSSGYGRRQSLDAETVATASFDRRLRRTQARVYPRLPLMNQPYQDRLRRHDNAEPTCDWWRCAECQTNIQLRYRRKHPGSCMNCGSVCVPVLDNRRDAVLDDLPAFPQKPQGELAR